MTTPEAAQRPLRPDNFTKPLPHLVALYTIGGVAILAAVALAIWSNNVDTTSWSIFEDVDASALALKVGLAAWADIMLVVGVSSIVGAIVLAGVIQIGQRAVATLSE